MGISLSDVVQISISASTASPTVPGFGKPLLLVGKVPVSFPATPQTYTSPTGLISAGFSTTDDAYLMASAAFSQTPSPPAVMVAKRSNKTVQVIKLKCLSAVQGDTYSITITTPAGVSTTITRTVPGSSTTTAEATAIAALIAAVSGFATTASAVDTITVVSPATAGQLNGYSNWSSNFYLTDTSADPGIAADLATAIAADNTWYGLAIDSQSKAEIVAAAAWCETNKKLFTPASYESTVPDNAQTTDVASTIQTSAYHYTGVLYSGNNTKSYAGLAWMANRFAGSPTPGDDTWAYKTLPGVAVDNLTETQFATLGNKFATGYVNMQGVNVTASGGLANSNSGGRNGFGEFLDVRRFLDWFQAQLQLAYFIVLLAARKTPYTDKGIAVFEGALRGALDQGVQAGGFVPGSYTIAAPTAAGSATLDRTNRTLRNLNWGAQLANAIHMVQSTGTVTN